LKAPGGEKAAALAKKLKEYESEEAVAVKELRKVERVEREAEEEVFQLKAALKTATETGKDTQVLGSLSRKLEDRERRLELSHESVHQVEETRVREEG